MRCSRPGGGGSALLALEDEEPVVAAAVARRLEGVELVDLERTDLCLPAVARVEPGCLNVHAGPVSELEFDRLAHRRVDQCESGVRGECGTDVAGPIATIVFEDCLIRLQALPIQRFEQPSHVAHLLGARVTDRCFPGGSGRGDRTASRLPHLPDIVVPVGVSCGPAQHRPVSGLANIPIVEPAILRFPIDRMIFVTGFAVEHRFGRGLHPDGEGCVVVVFGFCVWWWVVFVWVWEICFGGWVLGGLLLFCLFFF